MSAMLSGLLRFPDCTARVVLYRDRFLSIFLPPFEEAGNGVLPAVADLDRWVQRGLVVGVETAAIIPGLPFPVLTRTTLKTIKADGSLDTRVELQGMAQQPWHGLLVALAHRFEGDQHAPLPAGYDFIPAVASKITAYQRAEC